MVEVQQQTLMGAQSDPMAGAKAWNQPMPPAETVEDVIAIVEARKAKALELDAVMQQGL